MKKIRLLFLALGILLVPVTSVHAESSAQGTVKVTFETGDPVHKIEPERPGDGSIGKIDGGQADSGNDSEQNDGVIDKPKDKEEIKQEEGNAGDKIHTLPIDKNFTFPIILILLILLIILSLLYRYKVMRERGYGM